MDECVEGMSPERAGRVVWGEGVVVCDEQHRGGEGVGRAGEVVSRDELAQTIAARDVAVSVGHVGAEARQAVVLLDDAPEHTR